MELTYPIQRRCTSRAGLAAWIQGALAALRTAALIAGAPLFGLAFLIALPLTGLYVAGAAAARSVRRTGR